MHFTCLNLNKPNLLNFQIEYEEKKKAEGKKARDDKESVQEMLFSAFEKHQYYNIKDLVIITRQPIVYLKEILKDVCVYNLKNPHKNMWELKPEYRHYKDDNPAASSSKQWKYTWSQSSISGLQVAVIFSQNKSEVLYL